MCSYQVWIFCPLVDFLLFSSYQWLGKKLDGENWEKRWEKFLVLCLGAAHHWEPPLLEKREIRHFRSALSDLCLCHCSLMMMRRKIRLFFYLLFFFCMHSNNMWYGTFEITAHFQIWELIALKAAWGTKLQSSRICGDISRPEAQLEFSLVLLGAGANPETAICRFEKQKFFSAA